MGSFRYLSNVVTLTLDAGKCTGCGACLDVCPQAVLARNGGRRVEIADRDACMECGACRRNCPAGAIDVQSGVGCAAAVINGMLGREGACCCSVGPGNGKAAGGGCC